MLSYLLSFGITATAAAGSAVSNRAFIENVGQWNKQSQFRYQAPGVVTWLTSRGAVYDLRKTSVGDDTTTSYVKGQSIRLTLEGGRRATLTGLGEKRTKTTFIRGTEESYVRYRSRSFSRIQAKSVYEGIDLAWQISPTGQPRFDFLVGPGADTRQIRIRMEGADFVRAEGRQLVVGTRFGSVNLGGLTALQGGRKIPCSFVSHGDGSVRLEVGAYDRSQPLLIDPVLYKTYFGGSGPDNMTDTKTLSDGSTLCVGNTVSSDLPTTSGAYDEQNGSEGSSRICSFAAMMNPDGSDVEWCTYLESRKSSAYVSCCAIADGGRILLGGNVDGPGFPTTYGVPRPGSRARSVDGFICTLEPDGSDLLFGSLLGAWDGCTKSEKVRAIAVSHSDSEDRVYVCGETSSADYYTSGYWSDSTFGGQEDGFLTGYYYDRGSGALYLSSSTYLGGNGADSMYSIVANEYDVYACGYSASDNLNTSYSGRWSNSLTGNNHTDGIVARFSYDLYLYDGLYVGAAGGYEELFKIVRNPATGVLYAAGYTDANLFVTSSDAYKPDKTANQQGILVALKGWPLAVTASTFLSGEPPRMSPGILNSWTEHLAIDPSGDLHTIVNSWSYKTSSTISNATESEITGTYLRIDSSLTELKESYTLFQRRASGFWQGFRLRSISVNDFGSASVGAVVSESIGDGSEAAFMPNYVGMDGANDSVLWRLHLCRPASLRLQPSTVVGGNIGKGKLTLNGLAPSGGAKVLLRSNSALVKVPASLIVPEGQSSAEFDVQTWPTAVKQSVAITATYDQGSTTKRFSVDPPRLQSASLEPATVTGSFATALKVVLNGRAASGGVLIDITKGPDPANAVSLPPFAIVPEGEKEITIPVSTSPVATDALVTVTVVANERSRQLVLQVLQPRLDTFTITPETIVGGTLAQAKLIINLTGPSPSEGLIIQLSSSNASVLTFGTRVTIASGRKTLTKLATPARVDLNTPITITGKVGVIDADAATTLVTKQ